MERKPFAITLDPGSSLANHTGNWRTMRPVYGEHLPPCNQACPAGENIQGWLYYAEEGDYERAWRKIMEDNPFPALHGRVCYHPCETTCNRGQLDEAVSIHAVERFLGDYAIQQGWSVEPGIPTGKRVVVVGAGPSGLSVAYHLARFGHAVTIYDAGPAPGGMMRFGIPKYRLPRDILDAEIARITAMGVTLKLNHKVEDVEAIVKEGKFDAVFLAIGAHLSKRVEIPGRDAGRMVDALSFLHDMDVARRRSSVDVWRSMEGETRRSMLLARPSAWGLMKRSLFIDEIRNTCRLMILRCKRPWKKGCSHGGSAPSSGWTIRPLRLK